MPSNRAAAFGGQLCALLRKTGRRTDLGRAPCSRPHRHAACATTARPGHRGPNDLKRRFGDFYAVKGVTFQVARGEVFGLLGANGAGKSTTFRMLCGLLPATGGILRVAGLDLRHAPAGRPGAHRLHVARSSRSTAISAWARICASSAAPTGCAATPAASASTGPSTQFELAPIADTPSMRPAPAAQTAAGDGLRADARAGNPLSGRADLGRGPAGPARVLAAASTALAEQGVTVMVTTHFMEEAEYCDRLAIMAAGEILALGTPEEIKQRRRIRRPARADDGGRFHRPDRSAGPQRGDRLMNDAAQSTRRQPRFDAARRGMRHARLIRKEFYQILRDPSSIAIAFLLPVVLLLIFGYGVSLDVGTCAVAVVVEQPGADTASFTAASSSRGISSRSSCDHLREAEQALMAGRVDAIVHCARISPGSCVSRAAPPIQLIVNGVDANTARLISGYVQGRLAQMARSIRPAHGRIARRCRCSSNSGSGSTANCEPQFSRARPDRLIMTLIGALLTALVMAREWERGTMEALLVTPVTMREVLLGKPIPYFILGMGGMALSVAMGVCCSSVPLRGSLGVLFGAAALFLLVALGMGLLISTAAKNQFVAGQMAIIITFLPALILSGFIFDIGACHRRPVDHPYPGGPLLCGHAANGVPGGQCVVGDLAQRAGAGCDGRVLPRPEPAQLTSDWIRNHRCVLRILALMIKEFLALLKDKRSRLVAVRAAHHAVAGLRLCGDLRSQPHSLCRLQRRQRLASRDSGSRLRRVARFPAGGAPSRTRQEIARSMDGQAGAFGPAHRPDFSRELLSGQPAPVQVIVDGRNSNTAGCRSTTCNTIVGHIQRLTGSNATAAPPPGSCRNPGLVQSEPGEPLVHRARHRRHADAGGTMLVTALSVAREREQGTFDQLLVTPFRPGRNLIGKALPGFPHRLSRGDADHPDRGILVQSPVARQPAHAVYRRRAVSAVRRREWG